MEPVEDMLREIGDSSTRPCKGLQGCPCWHAKFGGEHAKGVPLIPSQEASCLIEATLLFRIVHYLWQQQSALKHEEWALVYL